MTQGREGHYEVAVGDRAIYLRVHGLASMNNCLCARDFIEHEMAGAHSFLIVDLADCTGMDSTFMGLMAGAATHRRENPPPAVAVVNATPSLKELLDGVGLTELLLVEDDAFDESGIEFVRLPDDGADEERLACVREAHESLVRVSASSERIFGPFLATLENEMKEKGLL